MVQTLSLSPSAQVLLAACARAIANGGSYAVINLWPLGRESDECWKEIPTFLEAAVERASGGQLTIRQADKALFRVKYNGEGCYLVACPFSTPAGTVTELTDDMQLVFIGPYDDGLSVPAERASQVEVRAYRNREAIIEIERQKDEQAASDAKMFLFHLSSLVYTAVASLPANDERRREAIDLLHRTEKPSLETLARACRLVGTDLRTVSNMP